MSKSARYPDEQFLKTFRARGHSASLAFWQQQSDRTHTPHSWLECRLLDVGDAQAMVIIQTSHEERNGCAVFVQATSASGDMNRFMREVAECVAEANTISRDGRL